MPDGFNVYYKIDPREPNLAVWVQDHINSLRRSIRELQSQIEMDVGDADTFLDSSYSVPAEPLGKGVRILFKPKSDSVWPGQFEVRLNGDKLEISAHATLVVKLKSSNRLELAEDR